jgi:hypothetical protein
VLSVLSAAGGWVTVIFEPQRRKGRKGFYFFPDQVNDQEKLNAMRASHSFSLLTIRFMPSFINGTFQFRRKPRLKKSTGSNLNYVLTELWVQSLNN